jgi:hypothetical protein
MVKTASIISTYRSGLYTTRGEHSLLGAIVVSLKVCLETSKPIAFGQQIGKTFET